jgi:hypothetical protein
VPPDVELAATSRLVLTQAVPDSTRPACPALDGPLSLSLREGDEIPFAGAIQVSVSDGQNESFPRRFLGLDQSVIRAEAGPVDVVVRGIPDAPPAERLTPLAHVASRVKASRRLKPEASPAARPAL